MKQANWAKSNHSPPNGKNQENDDPTKITGHTYQRQEENSSEIQPPTQSKKPQAALKTATATDSEKLFREGWQQGMIELMKKYDVDCVKVRIKRSKKSNGGMVWNKLAVKKYLNVE